MKTTLQFSKFIKNLPKKSNELGPSLSLPTRIYCMNTPNTPLFCGCAANDEYSTLIFQLKQYCQKVFDEINERLLTFNFLFKVSSSVCRNIILKMKNQIVCKEILDEKIFYHIKFLLQPKSKLSIFKKFSGIKIKFLVSDHVLNSKKSTAYINPFKKSEFHKKGSTPLFDWFHGALSPVRHKIRPQWVVF